MKKAIVVITLYFAVWTIISYVLHLVTKVPYKEMLTNPLTIMFMVVIALRYAYIIGKE
jgi:uncharacterized membrane protein HdeD (DUF308 family)